jgi:hypothetical protein
LHVGPCLENSSSSQPEEEALPLSAAGERSSPSPLPLVLLLLLLLLVRGAISSHRHLTLFSRGHTFQNESKRRHKKMESFGLEQPLCDYNESMDGLTDLWDTNSFDSVSDSRLYLTGFVWLMIIIRPGQSTDIEDTGQVVKCTLFSGGSSK